MNILINISEVAIITGHNKFKTKREFLIDFWKKNAKDDYEKFSSKTEFIKETDIDIIKKIAKENNIEILQDLKKCSLTKDTSSLNSIKKEIMKKVENLDDAKKMEITKSINNVTNTKFGIKNENDIATLYNKLTGLTIIKDNKYKKVEIGLYDKNICFYLGGKIDGLCVENGIIIEIKNRVNKLFYELRDYEKVQLMCYLYIFNAKKGHLVEAFKKKDGTDINVIELDYDESFMNYIKEKLIEFMNYFIKFLNDDNLKINILSNNNEIDFC